MYSCSHSAWGNSFYNQYLQNHAQMTQWYQQLQQAIDPTRGAYCCNGTHARPSHRGHTMHSCNPRGRPSFRGLRHCCSAQARPAYSAAQTCCLSVQIPQAGAHALQIPPAGRGRGRILQLHGYPMGSAHRRPQAPQVYVEEQEEESEDSTEEEDNSSSEDELVCDIDAFITLGNARDDSDKVSEESFELVDSVEDEKFKFEYVEMDEFGIMQRKYGKRREVNTMEDELLKKEQRTYLYGERADAICGLETLMAINFDHFSDMHQPVLWPVLPLAL